MSLAGGSIFAPDYPPLLRAAALWEMAFLFAEVDFSVALARLREQPTEPHREEIEMAAAHRGWEG